MPTQDDKSKADMKAATRAKENATQKAYHCDLGPAQLLSEHMDASGNPVPEPTWGTQSKKTKDPLDDDADLFGAMNAETADFD
ncbi:hypothetical protein N7471_013042 [Penicillium samsonianum]|uniref:uncharacterized protein n=1 Tax=Penicillium samsonianum TaxID=1882272 RepID=UPI0025495A58|nr:uncharacterized protein N7471_013042 [Penicillium samsonianum]KAJ6119091.1 hypothetical protein N7471_013042 [Penicillium samsonianum]